MNVFFPLDSFVIHYEIIANHVSYLVPNLSHCTQEPADSMNNIRPGTPLYEVSDEPTCKVGFIWCTEPTDTTLDKKKITS